MLGYPQGGREGLLCGRFAVVWRMVRGFAPDEQPPDT